MAITIKRSDLGRKDPPPDEWPGRDMTVLDVVQASGDERDWFSLQHRLDAYTWIQERFWASYNRRRSRRFDPQNNPMKFGQQMVVGDLGSGKSVLTCSDIVPYVAAGHPFFHNGPWLFGRKIEGSALYNIIGKIPRFAIVAYDETHVSFGSGMVGTTGVQSWDSDTAGFRKENCRVYMPTAKAVLLAPNIRAASTEVWRPIKVSVGKETKRRRPQLEDAPNHSKRANFIQAWETWRDYPFQAADIIDSGGARMQKRSGLGEPDAVYIRNNETVRLGFLLTDSFAPVESTKIREAALKAQMEDQWKGGGGGDGLDPRVQRLVLALKATVDDPDCPEWISPAALAFDIGMRPYDVRNMMDQLFGNIAGARHSARAQYSSEVLGAALPVMFALGGNDG